MSDPTVTPHRGQPPSKNPKVKLVSVRADPFLYDAFDIMARRKGFDLSKAVRRVMRMVVSGRVQL